jgi:hypothetical protein
MKIGPFFWVIHSSVFPLSVSLVTTKPSHSNLKHQSPNAIINEQSSMINDNLPGPGVPQTHTGNP